MTKYLLQIYNYPHSCYEETVRFIKQCRCAIQQLIIMQSE